MWGMATRGYVYVGLVTRICGGRDWSPGEVALGTGHQGIWQGELVTGEMAWDW